MNNNELSSFLVAAGVIYAAYQLFKPPPPVTMYTSPFGTDNNNNESSNTRYGYIEEFGPQIRASSLLARTSMDGPANVRLNNNIYNLDSHIVPDVLRMNSLLRNSKPRSL